MAQIAADKAIANEKHTKALIEEVDTRATKLNQYENGKIPKAMATALSKVADRQIKH